ncbi:MAG: hypothetical protein Q8N51_08640 [Gammaproteobacteria bacterium]|nr:hypothetical protein [Gammaproteobacteria bacterium]
MARYGKATTGNRNLPKRRFTRYELQELLDAPCQEDFEEILGPYRVPVDLGKFAMQVFMKRMEDARIRC